MTEITDLYVAAREDYLAKRSTDESKPLLDRVMEHEPSNSYLEDMATFAANSIRNCDYTNYERCYVFADFDFLTDLYQRRGIIHKHEIIEAIYAIIQDFNLKPLNEQVYRIGDSISQILDYINVFSLKDFDTRFLDRVIEEVRACKVNDRSSTLNALDRVKHDFLK